MDTQNTGIEKKRVRGQNFILRIALGVVFLFLGVSQFTTSRHEYIQALYQSTSPAWQSQVDFPLFVNILGALELVLALWLFSGKWLRLAGGVAMLLGAVSVGCLFTLRETAWDFFPLLLNAHTGQFLVKDVLILAVGFFILFEKKG